MPKEPSLDDELEQFHSLFPEYNFEPGVKFLVLCLNISSIRLTVKLYYWFLFLILLTTIKSPRISCLVYCRLQKKKSEALKNNQKPFKSKISQISPRNNKADVDWFDNDAFFGFDG